MGGRGVNWDFFLDFTGRGRLKEPRSETEKTMLDGRGGRIGRVKGRSTGGVKG